MARRKKSKEQSYGGYVPIPREFLFYLQARRLKLSDFGAYVAMLLAASFDLTTQQYRGYTSDIKMTEKAGFNRSTWHRHRKSLEKSGMMRSPDEEAYEGEFPVWTEWYENFNDGAFLQQNDERMQQYAADAHKKRARTHIDFDKMRLDREKISRSTEAAKSQSVAKMQHAQKALETTVERNKRNSTKNTSIAALQQQSRLSKKCENCGEPVSGTQIMWSQLKEKKILCSKCCPFVGSLPG